MEWDKYQQFVDFINFGVFSFSLTQLCKTFVQFFMNKTLFALLFSGRDLPDPIWGGSSMTTTAEGDGLIMTYGQAIYRFKCVSSDSCFFEKDENFFLRITRTKHFLLAVPPSLVEDC